MELSQMDAVIQVEVYMVTLITMKTFGPLYVKLLPTQLVIVPLGTLIRLRVDIIQEI